MFRRAHLTLFFAQVRLRRLSAPEPSPDGKSAVIPIQQWNPDTNKSTTALFLLRWNQDDEDEGGTCCPISPDSKSHNSAILSVLISGHTFEALTAPSEGNTDTCPVWLWDNRTVAFLSDR